jgi:hypothetical protein
MSKPIDPEQYAFQQQYLEETYDDDQGKWVMGRLVQTGGLTKREYFAARALQGILGCTAEYSGARDRPSRVQLAIAYADALLNELEDKS